MSINDLLGCAFAVVLTGAATASLGGRGEPSVIDVIPVGPFSEMKPTSKLPSGWKSISLAAAFKKTQYALVREDGQVVVRARSEDAAAGLGTERRIDPTTHPVVQWRWKVDSIVEKANVRNKSTEDCSACLFLLFEYNDLDLIPRLKIVAMRALGYDAIPTRAITYMWANQGEKDTVIPSPYAPWIKHVVVQSGTTRVGTWMDERRNVRADYRRIFGEEPPPIEGIGIMTDTDNTDGTATAYYGDIVFRRASPDSAAADPSTSTSP